MRQQGAWKQHPCNSDARTTFIFEPKILFPVLFYIQCLKCLKMKRKDNKKEYDSPTIAGELERLFIMKDTR